MMFPLRDQSLLRVCDEVAEPHLLLIALIRPKQSTIFRMPDTPARDARCAFKLFESEHRSAGGYVRWRTALRNKCRQSCPDLDKEA